MLACAVIAQIPACSVIGHMLARSVIAHIPAYSPAIRYGLEEALKPLHFKRH